jgi:hypothetical protein
MEPRQALFARKGHELGRGGPQRKRARKSLGDDLADAPLRQLSSRLSRSFIVMAGLDPAIYAAALKSLGDINVLTFQGLILNSVGISWMAGSSPAMTWAKRLQAASRMAAMLRP